MLTVYQKNFWGKKDVVVGHFADINAIFYHFKNIYGEFQLERFFSHNPCEFFHKFFDYYRLDTTGRLAASPPVYCMVIENERNIRYSREYILGCFRKIRKRKAVSYPSYFGGHNRHYRSFYRHPHTLQEKRMAATVLTEEGEPKWRAARNIANLPSTWEDLPHLDVCNCNWKRFRKTRWK